MEERDTITLFINQPPTTEDKMAVAMFWEVRKIFRTGECIYKNPKLRIKRIKDLQTLGLVHLPRLDTGAYWEGTEQIGEFLKLHHHLAN